MTWFLYLLRCRDGTLYCGVTPDVEGRLAAHRSGQGARYTKGRGPMEVVYREACGSKGDALRRERNVKAMTRAQKLALIAGTA